jgi:hypothetical protein
MVKGCATDIYWERKGTLGGKKLICGSKTCSRTQMEYATFRELKCEGAVDMDYK